MKRDDGMDELVRARTVVCSPHFDDSVLNCWSVLDRDEDCAVVNVFTGAPREGFVSWYDSSGGATDSAEQMQTRTIEDRNSLALAGKAPINLGLLEAQYRLHQSPLLHTLLAVGSLARFVLLRLPFIRPMLHSVPAPSAAELADKIMQAVPNISSVCVPAAIGGHRDHLLVREAGLVLASRGVQVRMYADLPYALRYGWPRWFDGSPGERCADRATAFWANDFKALGSRVGDVVRDAQVVQLTPEERTRKQQAVHCHATQIESLNLGRTRGRLQEDRTFAYEVYWELR